MLSGEEKVFADCCDFCQRVDDIGRKIEPRNTMAQRCKGDICATCKSCKQFVRNQKKRR